MEPYYDDVKRLLYIAMALAAAIGLLIGWLVWG